MKNKAISILLSILLVVTSFIPMAYTVEPVAEAFGNWDIINTTNAENQMPEKLENGQVWAGKKVTYEGDGIFEVELNAIGQKYRVETELPRDQYDVVLVLDRSPSMAGQRMDDMKDAAKTAVDQLLTVTGNRVAVISYGGYANQLISFSSNAGDIKSKIESISAENGYASGTGTNIQNAYFASEQLLKSRGATERKSAVILMSDGEPTYYHTSLDDHSGNRRGNGQLNSDWKYPWYTILQANKLKNAIPNLDIYTIGFGADSAAAERVLMPTEENTRSIRPNSYYEYRDVEQVRSEEFFRTSTRERDRDWDFWGVHWDYGPWSDWTAWSSYTKTGKVSSSSYSIEGPWNLIDDVQKTYSNDYSSWNLRGDIVDGAIDPNTRLNSKKTIETRKQYGSKEGFRTGTEYQVVNSKIPFNHKYYHDLSTITGDGADAILEIFTKIAKEITEYEPNLHQEEDKLRSSVIISDVIGEGFVLVDSENYNYNQATRTLTWTIEGDELNTQEVDATEIDASKLHTLKFKVKLNDDLKTAAFNGGDEVKTYYTNQSANVTFAVLENNPYYEGLNVTEQLAQRGSVDLAPAKGTVVVKHVDEKGDNLVDPFPHYELIGTEILSGQANLDETYELLNVSHNMENGLVKVNVTRETQEVVFTYGIKPTLTVIIEGDGTVSPLEGDHTYPRGTKVPLTVVSEENGYKFSHWEGTETDDEGNVYVDMTGDKVVKAIFIKPEVKDVFLTTKVNIEGAGTVTPADQTTHKQGSVVEVEATANEGFKFINWSGASTSTSAAITVTLDVSKELTANFEKLVEKNFILSATVNDESMGTITGTPNATYAPNTNINITAVAKEGYKFIGWEKAESPYSDQANLNFDLTEDTILVAVFEPETVVGKQFVLNASVVGEGSIVTEYPNASYPEGTEVTLKAVAEEGHKFIGWTGDVTLTDETITFKMDKNMTVVANFEPETVIPVKYVLNASVNGEGTITGTANDSYAPETEVTLTAAAKEGHKFMGWTGDVTSTDVTIAFKMDKNMTVVANFEPIPVYTLKINVVGEGLVTPANSEYREGTEVTVTATPKNGYRFVGWSGDLTSEKSEDKVLMNANKVLTATFVKLEKVRLTVNIIGEGTVTPDVREFDKGTVIGLVANPTAGWRFETWSGDATSTEANITLTMDSDKTVVARFVELLAPPSPFPPTPPIPTPEPEPTPVPTPTPEPTPAPTPEEEVVIEDEATPEGEAVEEVTPEEEVVEEVALEEEAIPEGAAKEEPSTPEVVEEIELIEEAIPEGSALPQTGQLPTSVFFGMGSVIMAAGVYLKRK